MSKCGCEQGGDCTKTTVCQGELVADKLAEALDTLITVELRREQAEAWAGAVAALKEYRG